jgi:tRNA nucleotidyltransferase (CCA-adding enzyme)
MRLSIPDNLRELAKEFVPDALYVVGGYVRDEMLRNGRGADKLNGVGCGVHIASPSEAPPDIDLASPLTESELLAKNIEGLAIIPVNPRIGTLKLIYKGGEYEYTTFRYDSYPIGGGHSPGEVIFTKDIELDARRRDFTVNAIYYDINNDTFIDPTGGLKDSSLLTPPSGILRTADAPQKTLSEDGLRILRMVRFAVTKGLSIHNDTLAAAKKNVRLLENISKERIRDEFLKILYADSSGIADAHYKGLLLLDEIGAFPYIIPRLIETKGAAQNSKYHSYDVFNHILMTVRYAEPRVRLAALFHDIGKPECRKLYGNNSMHALLSADIVYETLGEKGLRLTKAETARTAQLVKLHMYDIDMRKSEERLREFIQSHYYLVDDLLLLKQADYRAKGVTEGGSPAVDRMKKIFREMKTEKIPFTVFDLKVNGNDLVKMGYRYKEVGDALKALLIRCANDGTLVTREAQLEALIRRGELRSPE